MVYAYGVELKEGEDNDGVSINEHDSTWEYELNASDIYDTNETGNPVYKWSISEKISISFILYLMDRTKS